MASILLLNCGSSSIKYQLLDPAVGTPEAVGIVQRIGQELSTIDHKVGGESFHEELPLKNHTDGVAAVVRLFQEHGPSLDKVSAVGHRTVHGGEEFVEPTVITPEVVERMRGLIPLAPLHNPPGIAGIEGAQQVLPDVPHVAIFDTAFFAALPAEAYTYAIDQDVAKKFGIRRYGFHGTSHEFVSRKAAEFLGRPKEQLRIITAHIGNGASISAVEGGKPIDTSMGLTPLEGLVMGTRSGDVDPGIFTFLTHQGYSADEVDALLNKSSGMLGLCGLTDMRDVSAAVEAGEERATLAFQIYCRRVVKYIGAYLALLGGADALVFTAGVGENSPEFRTEVLSRLTGLGVRWDEEANLVRSPEPRLISTPDSTLQVVVLPTNEELAMAQQVAALISA